VATALTGAELHADAEWIRLHRLAIGEFDFRLRQVLPEYWIASTPCDEWDTSDLVRHVVVETLIVAGVLAGRDPAVVRAEFTGFRSVVADPDMSDGVDGDDEEFGDDDFARSILDHEPAEDFIEGDMELVWEDAHRAAVAAFAEADLDGFVGDPAAGFRVIDYLRERTADIIVHAWDLADAVSVDDRLDLEVVVAVYEWAKPHEHRFAASPLKFDLPLQAEPGADLQQRLLALFGREA
jgi:hypothetical protein